MKLKNFTLSLGTILLAASSATAANVAQGKTGYASTGTPAQALDGNNGTRWESTQKDNQWFYVDLGAETSIDHVKFLWEGAYAKHYKIHVANEITEAMTANLTDEDDTNNFSTGWTEIAEVEKTLSSFPASETVTPPHCRFRPLRWRRAY